MVLEPPQLLPSTLIDCYKIHGDMQSSRGCQKYLVHVPCVSLMCRDWRSYSTLARLDSSSDVEHSIYPSEPQVDIHVTILPSWHQTSRLVERVLILIAALVVGSVSKSAFCTLAATSQTSARASDVPMSFKERRVMCADALPRTPRRNKGDSV